MAPVPDCVWQGEEDAPVTKSEEAPPRRAASSKGGGKGGGASDALFDP